MLPYCSATALMNDPEAQAGTETMQERRVSRKFRVQPKRSQWPNPSCLVNWPVTGCQISARQAVALHSRRESLNPAMLTIAVLATIFGDVDRLNSPPRKSWSVLGTVVLIVALFGILAAWMSLAVWTWMSSTDTFGIIVSLLVGFALMALMYYSSTRGYDERAGHE